MRCTHSKNYGEKKIKIKKKAKNAPCIPEIWAEFDFCPSNLTRCNFIKNIKSIHFI